MDFREQIKEDIQFYREQHPGLTNLNKDEWAFNYWILDKLFCEDDDEIENKIIDYSDNGIDCYIWHEETRDLYLIQNKYYSDGTVFQSSYFDNAVEDGLAQLTSGTYRRSSELQGIYNKYRDDADFYIYHYFYVSNESKSESVEASVRHFNERNSDKRRFAQVFYLSDIEEAFYGEPIVPERHTTIELETPNKGTRLQINNEAYNLSLAVDAQYIMLPVKTLYETLNTVENQGYPIFDANIREFLGAGRGVNKGIINTLLSPTDRKNFFYYNNGITFICASMSSKTQNGRLVVSLEDPQIVNGCQTVSSIKQALDSVPNSRIDDEYDGVFVMARILVIPNEDDEAQRLRKDIVKYNNSQNNIDEKTFESNSDEFRRLQREFEKRGFLLLLKQSDKQKNNQKYKTATELREKSMDLLNRYGLEKRLLKPVDFMIPLERLMQVVLAFYGDAQQAFQKKGNLLKKASSQYDLVTKALRSPELTTQRLLNLYLLYLASEKEKNSNTVDSRVPITWYLIEGFSQFECDGGNIVKTDEWLENTEKIVELLRLYKMTTTMYLKEYQRDNEGKEYNSMIKEKLDLTKLRYLRDTAKQGIAMG